jgi:HAE1 family hydrophobic/amphiphilic exporter-1
MAGPIGLLFREFAVVVTLSILVSAVVSLTVVPMLCSRFLPKPGQHPKEYVITKQFDRAYEWTLKKYIHFLDLALVNRRRVLIGAFASFVITIALFVYSPKGFFPEEDIGQLRVTVEASEDTSFSAMMALQDQAAKVVDNDPNVATSISILGGGQSSGRNTGRFFIILKPKNERQKMSQIMEGLRAKFKEIPGIQVYMSPVQNLQLGGRSSKSRYQFTLQSVGFEGVNEWAEKLLQKMRADPIFKDVTSDSQLKGLNVKIEIDREKAASAGVSIADIRTALYSSFGERQVSTIYTPVNTYYVILETAENDRQFETDLNKVFVRGRATDKLIPLSSLASFVRTVGPTAVNHQGQIPEVTISFNLAPDVFLGDATKAIDGFVKAVDLPPSIITSYGGDAAVFKDNQSGQIILLLAALGVIYILLGVLYESYIHPLTILAGLPSAAIGAILSLRIFGFELTVVASIGILLLIGIVKKNAILMIDFALDAQRNQGMTPEKAIREACILRFRPIMMTTIAALMGALPIALGIGAGAELRQPLGISVAGGLIFSQFVTLIITPVIYLYLDKYAGNGPIEIPPSVLEGT